MSLEMEPLDRPYTTYH